MNFDREERALLAELADVLIPASAEMPSASKANATGKWLDKVLIARPDLAGGLKTLLQEAAGGKPEETIAELRAHGRPAFEILAQVVTGAYFMNPAVQRVIGYAGQVPRPMETRPDYLDDGLLEPVKRRGPIYRPTPEERR